MKLLILDVSSEAQAFCAKRIEQFSPGDQETLDLKVKLVGERDYADRIQEADVVVIGSGVGEKAISIARHINSISPWLHLIMFVTDEAYGGSSFRAANSAGVRKVFPDSASPLDFLQELVAIHGEFRKEGRTKEARVITITHAKGGVGATSIAAALAEVCSVFNRRTMLWDLDVETRDLSRSLTVTGVEAKVVSSWINGSRDVSRESLKDALIPISSDVQVLMPPDRMAESIDLVCHIDSVGLVQRVIDVARLMFDVVIVDTGGRMGPATGALMRSSDIVMMVVDETVLGLTAVDLYLTFIKSVLGNSERLVFLVNPYTGSMLTVPQIMAELEPVHHLGEAPWRLPPVPHDPKASQWPGSGRTLYSMGQKATRAVLEKVASDLGLLGNAAPDHQGKPEFAETGGQAQKGGLLSRIFNR